MTLFQENLTLPAALPGPANPYPIFRNPEWDRSVPLLGTVSERYRKGLGKGVGHRLLPYGRQENYTRTRVSTEIPTLVLENRHLRAVFLPSLGGRLYSLQDKASGRELLHRNPCIQMGNLALADAWFAGGIEWNIGQFGHSCHTSSPIFAARVQDPDGTTGLRLGEFERMKGLFWQIDFRLDENLPVLWAHARVANPLEHPVELYWWTNMAVAQRRGTRVLSSADKAFCMVNNPGQPSSFAEAMLPLLPGLNGKDGTYAENYRNANEFFFLCDDAETPWEAVVDADGRGFFECASHPLSHRKLFVWGKHAGGERWQRFLAPEGGEPYLEIQAGLAPSQLHTVEMPPQTAWTWTEAFGAFDVPPAEAHEGDWVSSRNATARAIFARLTPRHLQEAAKRGAETHDLPLGEIYSPGSTWGWVEKKRLQMGAKPDPCPGLSFPEPGPQDPATPWRHLLENGVLPAGSPAEDARSWMVQAEWQEHLAGSLRQPGGAHARAWNAWGIFCVEVGRDDEAEEAFLKSYEMEASREVARNLAALAHRS